VKGRHGVHVELDRGEIAGLASQQGGDAIHCSLNVGRNLSFARVGKSLEQALSRLELATLRQLNAHNASLAPRDAAVTNGRLEERKGLRRHEAQTLTAIPDEYLANLAVWRRLIMAPPKRFATRRWREASS
jgi:hypothetical protein